MTCYSNIVVISNTGLHTVFHRQENNSRMDSKCSGNKARRTPFDSSIQHNTNQKLILLYSHDNHEEMAKPYLIKDQ